MNALTLSELRKDEEILKLMVEELQAICASKRREMVQAASRRELWVIGELRIVQSKIKELEAAELVSA